MLVDKFVVCCLFCDNVTVLFSVFLLLVCHLCLSSQIHWQKQATVESSRAHTSSDCNLNISSVTFGIRHIVSSSSGADDGSSKGVGHLASFSSPLRFVLSFSLKLVVEHGLLGQRRTKKY